MVAHDAPASATIFGMTKRFHDKCPEILRPSTRYSSRKELAFVLESSKMVATAAGGCLRGCHGQLARVPWSASGIIACVVTCVAVMPAELLHTFAARQNAMRRAIKVVPDCRLTHRVVRFCHFKIEASLVVIFGSVARVFTVGSGLGKHVW